MFPVFSPCFPYVSLLFADGFPRFFPGPQHSTGEPAGHRQVDSFQDYKAQLRKEVLKGPATERGVGAWDVQWAVISWNGI